MITRIYRATRNQDGVTEVTVDNKPLPIYDNKFDVFQFSWGDDSNGAKQLAYSILYKEYRNVHYADLYCQVLHGKWIKDIKYDSFVVDSDFITTTLTQNNVPIFL